MAQAHIEGRRKVPKMSIKRFRCGDTEVIFRTIMNLATAVLISIEMKIHVGNLKKWSMTRLSNDNDNVNNNNNSNNMNSNNNNNDNKKNFLKIKLNSLMKILQE